jgi:hypothetical protein
MLSQLILPHFTIHHSLFDIRHSNRAPPSRHCLLEFADKKLYKLIPDHRLRKSTEIIPGP